MEKKTPDGGVSHGERKGPLVAWDFLNMQRVGGGPLDPLFPTKGVFKFGIISK